MILSNNNLSVLPFYTRLEEQDFRKPWAYKDSYALSVDAYKLIPFFFIVPKDSVSGATISFTLHKSEGSVDGFLNGSETTSTILLDSGLSFYFYDNYDVVMYDGAHDLINALSSAYYYLEVSFNYASDRSKNFKLYSDIFVPCANTSHLIKIEWYCMDDLEYEGGVIPYSKGFVNRLFVDSEIAMPNYTFTEEGEERDGIFFASKQISQKTFRFNFVGTEYLCDVLRLVRMSDRIIVTDQMGRVYKCNSFLLDTDWQTQGHYAGINIEMETDTIVKMCGHSLASVPFSITPTTLLYSFSRAGEYYDIAINGSRIFSFVLSQNNLIKYVNAYVVDLSTIRIESIRRPLELGLVETLVITSDLGESITIKIRP